MIVIGEALSIRQLFVLQSISTSIHPINFSILNVSTNFYWRKKKQTNKLSKRAISRVIQQTLREQKLHDRYLDDDSVTGPHSL